MKVEISVAEVVQVFKELQEQPGTGESLPGGISPEQGAEMPGTCSAQCPG